MVYLPINCHGLIGDLHTAALVGEDGRIVWLPWPRFDSPSIFAALLDDGQGGEWSLAPNDVIDMRQAYDGLTAILLTEFTTSTGSAELRDWMTPWDGEAPSHDLWRVLVCTAGEVSVQGRFAPRPDYARQSPVLQRRHNGLYFEAHGLQLDLESNLPWEIAGAAAKPCLRPCARAMRCNACFLRVRSCG